MFDFIGSGIDGLYKIFWLIIILYLVVSGGIGYLLRLISKPLKVDFTDRIIKNLDGDFLDLQLLRLYHGINVLNKKDARLVSKAISKGILSEKNFRFLSFAPPIGKFKHGKAEIVLYVALVLLFFASILIVCNSVRTYKYNYASFNAGNERALISEIYVYDPESNEYFNAKQCRELTTTTNKKILISACGYLLTKDPAEKRELMTAIENNNSSFIAAMILIVLLFIITSFLTLGYVIYFDTNNKFIDFKNNEERRFE
ncbi:hypothetical protein NUF60_000551 [Yersinia enterocolitica]|uniref:hypothetical protein n=1 Tax=Yersinia enterocolitica TaxID=630 RepID=UPI001C60D221|nr:hypothetical protein [Yersinia enterocolitica]EKN3444730.1 hypothetical protein [Yersinia enterocolitica]EKN4168531.1 hypothetical protein [Yersinia enterocolitica]EKN4797883.1 hypothetical protein [Yersinia enterocolitica]EKN5108319.1 hypothetical protein [Yersinia enterocolitica]ELI8201579.1 hypothetical protein [Yersinia enterocolitica]